MTWDLIGQGVCSYELRPLLCILEVRHVYEEDLHSLILYIHAVQCVFTILTSTPLSQTQTRHTSRHTYAQVIDTSSHIYTSVQKKSLDTSSHIYTKPVKKKESMQKPVAARSTDRTATDGDSEGGTTPPDHHSSEGSDLTPTPPLPPRNYNSSTPPDHHSSEGSDLTPPLPPRHYNSSEFDIPPLILCASTSADKLAGTKPTRQCTSCTILPRPRTGSTTVSCLLLQVVKNSSETEFQQLCKPRHQPQVPADRLETYPSVLVVWQHWDWD